MILSVVIGHVKSWALGVVPPAVILVGVSFVDAVTSLTKLGQFGLVVGGLIFSYFQIKKIRLEIENKKSRPDPNSESGC
jgi:hypothetical protein